MWHPLLGSRSGYHRAVWCSVECTQHHTAHALNFILRLPPRYASWRGVDSEKTRVRARAEHFNELQFGFIASAKTTQSDKAETQLSKYFQNDFQNLTHHHRVSSLTKTVIGGWRFIRNFSKTSQGSAAVLDDMIMLDSDGETRTQLTSHHHPL